MLILTRNTIKDKNNAKINIDVLYVCHLYILTLVYTFHMKKSSVLFLIDLDSMSGTLNLSH